jgi:hypothetical protein
MEKRLNGAQFSKFQNFTYWVDKHNLYFSSNFEILGVFQVDWQGLKILLGRPKPRTF